MIPASRNISDKGETTILLVDDAPDNLAVLNSLLGERYKIKIANNGEQALGLANLPGDAPDLILLDIMMPGVDGYDVCRRLKKTPNTAAIPVIFITAKTDEEDEKLGFEVGAVDYITKPISPPIVEARVKTHLALRQANQALEDALAAETDLLEKTLAGSIKMLSDALSLSAPDAFGEATRVNGWAHKVSRDLGLERAWELTIAAMLYPVGMIGAPREVIEKAHADAALSPEEKELIEHAPETGAKLLDNIPRMHRVAEIVRYAGNRFDGVGTPASEPSDNKLPLGSRLLKILSDLAKSARGRPLSEANFAELEIRESEYDQQLLAKVKASLDPSPADKAAEGVELQVPVLGLKAGDVLLADIVIAGDENRAFLTQGTRLARMHVEHLRRIVKICDIVEPLRVERTDVED